MNLIFQKDWCIMYKIYSGIRLLALVLIIFSASSLQAMNGAVGEIGYFDQAKNALQSSGNVLSDNIQMVHLVRAMCHIPYIVTVDSNDAAVVRSTALLASSSSGFKLIYERLANHPDYKLIYNLYHEPKLLGYLLASAYDVMRFMGATDIALKNEVQQGKMRGFKLNQSIQLLVEICLRGLAFASNYQNPGLNGQQSMLSCCAAECADWVEIWRLLSRYSTYMNMSKVEAKFNVSIKKEEDEFPDEAMQAEDAPDSADGIDSIMQSVEQLENNEAAPAA